MFNRLYIRGGGYEMDDKKIRIEKAVSEYGDIIFRTCFIILGNKEDAQDAVQDTIIKYIKKSPEFKEKNQEKAWILKVAANRCKDILRYRKSHPKYDLEFTEQFYEEKEDTGILEALMKIPEKYRLVLTLYYIEEYKISEIAVIISKTPSAVKMRLKKGRELLEKKFREEYMI